jgi:hypothetical protein
VTPPATGEICGARLSTPPAEWNTQTASSTAWGGLCRRRRSSTGALPRGAIQRHSLDPALTAFERQGVGARAHGTALHCVFEGPCRGPIVEAQGHTARPFTPQLDLKGPIVEAQARRLARHSAAVDVSAAGLISACAHRPVGCDMTGDSLSALPNVTLPAP